MPTTMRGPTASFQSEQSTRRQSLKSRGMSVVRSTSSPPMVYLRFLSSRVWESDASAWGADLHGQPLAWLGNRSRASRKWYLRESSQRCPHACGGQQLGPAKLEPGRTACLVVVARGKPLLMSTNEYRGFDLS